MGTIIVYIEVLLQTCNRPSLAAAPVGIIRSMKTGCTSPVLTNVSLVAREMPKPPSESLTRSTANVWPIVLVLKAFKF